MVFVSFLKYETQEMELQYCSQELVHDDQISTVEDPVTHQKTCSTVIMA